MHDASAKIPSGILNGNINQYGDFDQCLNVIAPNDEFSGKYCLAHVQLSVSDEIPQLKRIQKLVQSHDAFVNEIDDVSIRTSLTINCLIYGKRKYLLIFVPFMRFTTS